jgi:hypothetical protein
MAYSDEDLKNPPDRGADPQSYPGGQARQGTEAHSDPSNQDRRKTEPQAAYDRFQGQRMGGGHDGRQEPDQPVGYGQPAEYDDRYSLQGGKPQGQSGILGEKDLKPMPNAGTAGGSGEFARKPESERNR